MKKVLAMTLAGILALSIVACKKENGESQSAGTTSQTSQSTTAPKADSTQADNSESNSTKADNSESNSTKADNSESNSTQAGNSEDEPNMITGTLYAPFADIDIREMDFGYEEGKCTPERIAEALTEWTGLVYDITATVDLEYNTVIVDWKSDSSFAKGEPPIPQKEGFEFYDQETMRWFMLNSLYNTIRVNMGINDVYYSIDGSDLNDIGLEQDFNPAIAYNKLENPHIVIVD